MAPRYREAPSVFSIGTEGRCSHSHRPTGIPCGPMVFLLEPQSKPFPDRRRPIRPRDFNPDTSTAALASFLSPTIHTQDARFNPDTSTTARSIFHPPTIHAQHARFNPDTSTAARSIFHSPTIHAQDTRFNPDTSTAALSNFLSPTVHAQDARFAPKVLRTLAPGCPKRQRRWAPRGICRCAVVP